MANTDDIKSEPAVFGLAPPRNIAEYQDRVGRQMENNMLAQKMFGNGGFAGSALAQGLFNTGLPPDQEAMVKAQERAQYRFENVDREQVKLMDVGQKSRYFRKILAEEAMRGGLYAQGAQLFKQVESESQEVMKRMADLEKVGVDIDKTVADTEDTMFDLGRKRLEATRGKMATIYGYGSSDPNKGINAFIDDNGDAHVGDKVIPLGGYTTARPLRPLQGRGPGARAKPSDYGYTPTELGKNRALQRDVVSQMNAALRIKEIMQESMTNGGTVDILGGAGRGSSIVTKVVDEISAMGRAIKKAGGSYSSDLEITNTSKEGGLFSSAKPNVRLDGTESTALKAVDAMEGIEWRIPPSIRKDETQQRRYKAALINLAYAVARAEEPGNPRLSDDDFKRNLQQIADGTTSPETLRRIFMDRVGVSRSDYEMTVKQMPAELRNSFSSQEAMDQYDATSARFDKEFSQSFGTAGVPGPGLVGGDAEEERIDLGGGAYLRRKRSK